MKSQHEKLFLDRATAYIRNISRETLIAERPLLSKDELQKLDYMMQRFMSGEPQEYIFGETGFYGVKLKVDKRCFIPRPETELLVDEALKLINAHKLTYVADIGTGSGAIAIAIASNSEAEVRAVEKDPNAAEIARENVAMHGLKKRITVTVGSLLEPVMHAELIVANLPYIGTEKHAFVADSVKNYEPVLALYGGADGLRLYEELFRQVRHRGEGKMRINDECAEIVTRFIIGEIGFSQREDLDALLHTFTQEFPGMSWQIKCDLAGLDRYFVVTLQ